jgi:hypothetical protein
MTATKKTTGKKTTTPAKKAPPAKATKPAKKPAPPATEAAPVAPPYPGYEPYDVAQVCDEGTWADFETIRTPEEGEQARKLCDLTGERTYRIVAGDKQTVKVAPPEPKPEPKTRTKKAKPEPKPKKVSALDAAAKVLATTGEPMTTKAMIEAMTERGLWTSPGGKTPQRTVYAAILREVATKGTKARFRKTAPGHFAFNTESTKD